MQGGGLAIYRFAEEELSGYVHGEAINEGLDIYFLDPTGRVFLGQGFEQNLQMAVGCFKIGDLTARELRLELIAVVGPGLAFGSEDPVA